MEKLLKQKVLVFDKHRGIYWGVLSEILENNNTVYLTNARHCFYFGVRTENPDHKGVYSLATLGPTENSKIGPQVNLYIRDVSKIVECSSEANIAWEQRKWSS